MKLLCKLLGCATILLGLYTWMNIPIMLTPDGVEHPAPFYYTATAIGCVIGGIFWFAIAKILENQELIMEHFNIHKPTK